MSEARVLLLGGSGFVGSNLLRNLCLTKVVAPSLQEANLTDPDSLRHCIGPGDVVINAAGYANATDTTARGRSLFRSVNVDGVSNLANVCSEIGVAHLVHISSVAAMGRLDGEGLGEDIMIEPQTPYAASKLEGERILAEYPDKIPITILRPTSVFGEGRGLARTLCAVASKRLVPLPGGGRARIPFTYIDNVARGVELTLGNEKCYGRTFIVGDLKSYPLQEIVMELAHAMHVRPRVVSVPCGLAWAGATGLELLARVRRSSAILDRGRLNTLTNSVSYSIRALQEATGYEPPYSLRQAAQRIAAWYVDN